MKVKVNFGKFILKVAYNRYILRIRDTTHFGEKDLNLRVPSNRDVYFKLVCLTRCVTYLLYTLLLDSCVHVHT